MSNSDIAYEVSLLLTDKESKAPEKGWRFQEGVVVFPEAECPYCKEIVKSKAVWVMSETKLLGQAVPRRGRELIMDAPRHPHATPSDICFGNAFDPLHALFGALNPDSAWVEVDQWLKGKYWEHECEEMRKGDSCEWCGDEIDEGEEFSCADSIYCSSCFYERAFYCDRCSEAYSIDEMNNPPNGSDYCNECFNENYFNCYECSEAFKHDDRMTFDDEDYCGDCWNDKFFNCDDCSENFELSEMKGDERKCSECYVEPVCDACNEILKDDEEDTCTLCLEAQALQPELPLESVESPCSICGTTPTPIICDDCNRSFCIDHEVDPCPCGAELTVNSLEFPSEDTRGEGNE